MFFKIKLATITLIFIFLTACSSRWIYNQLDWLIIWYVDDYVSINELEPEFSGALDELLYWHRTTQLPLYRLELQTIKESINGPFDEARFELHYLTFTTFTQTTLNKAGEKFIPLISKMSEQQKTELLENLADKNTQYAERNIEIGELASRHKTLEKMQEFMEDALGELSDSQLNLMAQWAKTKPWMAPALYQNRLNWQQNLSHILKNTTIDQKALKGLFKNPQRNWSVAFNTQKHQNQQAMQSLITKMLPTLTQKQRNHLIKKIDSYIEDLDYLISNA